VVGSAAPLAREKKLRLAYISRQRLPNPHRVFPIPSHLLREGEGEEKEGERKRKRKRAAEHLKSGAGTDADSCPAQLRPIRTTLLVRATLFCPRLHPLRNCSVRHPKSERGREGAIPNPHLV
jgi:hypothetical protein